MAAKRVKSANCLSLAKDTIDLSLMFGWCPTALYFHVDQMLMFWCLTLIFCWLKGGWNIDVLTSCLLSINFCEIIGLFFVDVEQKLTFGWWRVDKVLMKCWFLLIFCWFLVGVLFEHGAPHILWQFPISTSCRIKDLGLLPSRKSSIPDSMLIQYLFIE